MKDLTGSNYYEEGTKSNLKATEHDNSIKEENEEMTCLLQSVYKLEENIKRMKEYINDRKMYIVYPCIERMVYVVQLIQIGSITIDKGRLVFWDSSFVRWEPENFVKRVYLDKASACRMALRLMQENASYEEMPDDKVIEIAKQRNMMYSYMEK